MRDRRRRLVLIGTLPPPVTGQSIAFEMLVEGLRPRHEIAVIDIGDRTGRRDRSFSSTRLAAILGVAARVARAASRADLVYLTIAQSRWGFLRDAALILAARLSRAPIVLHLHGGGYASFYESAPAALRLLIRAVLGEASRIIVLAESFRGQFAFLGDGGGRIAVVPNGSPVPLAAPRRAPRGDIRLLFLSNLLVEKGYQDVVAALPLLRRRLPDGVRVSLVLAGKFSLGKDDFRDVAEMEADLERRVAELGLAGVVRHVGLVEGEDKRRALDEADLFLLPTYYGNEGQPLALIEALSRGLPVISTAWRGLGDIVTDGANGLVVPPRSPDAIAAAVARLACDAPLYERCSAAAIETARQFTRDSHVDRMAEILEGAIRLRTAAA